MGATGRLKKNFVHGRPTRIARHGAMIGVMQNAMKWAIDKAVGNERLCKD